MLSNYSSHAGNYHSLKRASYNSPFISAPKPEPKKVKPEEFLRQLQKDIKATPDEANRAKLVNNALEQFKTDPNMSLSIVATGLQATHNSGRASLMGNLMKDHAGLVLDVNRDLRNLQGAPLSHMDKELLERLPFNQLDISGAHLPADTNLANNPYMKGANFENVHARNLIVPDDANITAPGADVRQDNASNSTFALSRGGALTGFHALPSPVTKTALTSDKAASFETSAIPLVTSTGKQAKWAGMISDPTPFAAAPA